MAWLLFARSQNSLTLFRGEPPHVFHGEVQMNHLRHRRKEATWPAHNDTVSYGKGAWPIGYFEVEKGPTCPDGFRRDHLSTGPGRLNTVWGSQGAFEFDVSRHDRHYMQVHAGRWSGESTAPGHLAYSPMISGQAASPYPRHCR